MKYFVLALVLLSTPANAASSLYSLYAAGRYEDAIRAGVGANSADGFAIAARAEMAEAALQPSPCLSCLRRAEGFARKAVAIDSTHADGHVWLAASLGLEGRILGMIRARSMAVEAKAHLDAALKDDPRDPYALAGLGGWNIEIVCGGGAVLAALLYGAREEQGLALFDRAVTVAPGNVAVRYQIALSLSNFGPVKFHARIVDALHAAIDDTPQTEYEKFTQTRAAELLASLDRDDPAAFVAKVHTFQGYPT